MCAPCVMGLVEKCLSRRELLGMAMGAAAVAVTSAKAQGKVAGKAFSNVADLTHVLSEAFPMFPGATPPKISVAVTVQKDGYFGNNMTIWEHSGTHMDAPAHFVDKGMTADVIPADKLVHWPCWTFARLPGATKTWRLSPTTFWPGSGRMGACPPVPLWPLTRAGMRGWAMPRNM